MASNAMPSIASKVAALRHKPDLPAAKARQPRSEEPSKKQKQVEPYALARLVCMLDFQVDLSGYTNLLTSLLRLSPKESFPVNPKASIMDHKYKRSPDDSEKYFEHTARGQTKQGMLTVPHKLTPQERCEAP
jgi:hypothetical protein